MALVLRGRNKGVDLPIHQFCNDWFTLEDGSVVSPSSLKLTTAEIVDVLEAKAMGRTGTMFAEFELNDDGTFKRVRR